MAEANFIDSVSDRGGFSNGDYLLGTWNSDSDRGGVVPMRHINGDQCYVLRSLLCPASNGILHTLYMVPFLVGGVGHI